LAADERPPAGTRGYGKRDPNFGVSAGSYGAAAGSYKRGIVRAPHPSNPPAAVSAATKPVDLVAGIVPRIRVVRRHFVLWDSDLAELYALPLRRFLNEAGLDRPMPGDFWFPAELEEIAAAGVEQPSVNGPRFLFTEHGAVVVALRLKTPAATAMSVKVARAFQRVREGEGARGRSWTSGA